MKILLFDDNMKMRDLIKDILPAEDTKIFQCGDGEVADKMYSMFGPDVVLMDIQMPNVDGFSATTMILNEHPEAKIIMVTDFDDSALQEKAKSMGVHSYLLKQNLIELPRVIAAVLMN